MEHTQFVRRTVLAGFLLTGLAAFREKEEDLGPDHADDPRWAMFRGVKVKADLKKGVATAAFPPDLLKAANQLMDIGGYVIPLEASPDSRHFLLTRRSSGCPFCPPNEANEAVEVFTIKKVPYEQRQFFVKGRLRLIPTSDKGLFFQIHEATAS